MGKILLCDVCKKETDEIVGKLFFTPLGKSNNANSFHSHYTHHADVGSCCAERLLSGFNFTKRKTAKEYAASRRKAVKS